MNLLDIIVVAVLEVLDFKGGHNNAKQHVQ